jgi:hypothetical protein
MTVEKLTPIDSWDEVPEFASEAEEQAFWDSHTLGEPLLEAMQPRAENDPDLPPAREKTIPDEVRRLFDDDTREGLLALAEKRGISVRQLLRSMVLEQLQVEEERETVQ